MKVEKIGFLENDNSPKGYLVKDMTAFAIREGIPLPKKIRKEDLFQTIKAYLQLQEEEEEGSIDTSIYSDAFPSKYLTILKMKNDAAVLGIEIPKNMNRRKGDIFKVIKNHIESEDMEDSEELVIDVPPQEQPFTMPTDGDMVGLVNDIRAGKSLNSKRVVEMLENLENAGFVSCEWYKIRTGRLIGSGVQGEVRKFGDKSSKTTRYEKQIVDDEKNFVTIEYNYLPVLFSVVAKKISDDGNSPNLMIVDHIYKCDGKKNIDIPDDPYILNIIEYIDCPALYNVSYKFNKEQIISIFLQIYSTIMTLSWNRIAHLDLHNANILICKTDIKHISYNLLRTTIPVYGYIAKIIDYDFVGIAVGEKPYWDSPMFFKGATLTMSSSGYLNNLPVIFILSQLNKFFLEDGMVRSRGDIFNDSPIKKFYDAINERNPKKAEGKFKLAVLQLLNPKTHGYNNYGEAWGLCNNVYIETVKYFGDMIKK